MDGKKKDIFFAFNTVLVVANKKKPQQNQNQPLLYDFKFSKNVSLKMKSKRTFTGVRKGKWSVQLRPVNKISLFPNAEVKKIIALWYQPLHHDGWCWFCSSEQITSSITAPYNYKLSKKLTYSNSKYGNGMNASLSLCTMATTIKL